MSKERSETEKLWLGFIGAAWSIGNLFLSAYYMTLVWRWYFESASHYTLTTRSAVGGCMFVSLLRATWKVREKNDPLEELAAIAGLSLSLSVALFIAWVVKP